MARKKTEIIKKDTEMVFELAKLGATKKEIAEFFGVDEKTIKNNYSIFYTKGRAELKRTLRQKMIEVAMKGNVVMLIFLAKNFLQMSDEESGEEEIKVIIKRLETKNEKR